MKNNFKLLVTGAIIGTLLYTGAHAQYCTTKEAKARESKLIKFDTTKGRGLADNFFLWDVGQQIQVRFLNGTPEQQAKVMELAKQWEQYANIKFIQVFAEPSNIRVEFSDSDENYSLLGSDANQGDPTEHTMHLFSGLFNDPTRLKRTVVHEFGHALGFMHEHSSPITGINWNKDTMYKFYAKYGWDQDMVDAQVFKVYEERYTNGTKYDPKSIMHYPIPSWQTTNGFSVGWNTDISEGDKQLAALLYPASGVRATEVPRISILNYTTTKIKADKTAGGLKLYPSFNINTSGATGDVYLCVLLFDKDGNAIMATDEKYNVSGVVGAYKGFRMGPGKKISVNKQNPEEFELFIPFSNIPNTPNTSEIQVVFRTFVSDGKDLKSTFFSTPVSYQMGAR
ncbi:MAG: M12 family metallopeptidase [Chitinophagaceae bacterium]|nr:M12 family metallopeptidase [Chitinophagaceae bacterium]